MAGGEVCKQTFSKAVEPLVTRERLDLPGFPQNECCFKLPVLAGQIGVEDSPNKNDQHWLLNKYDKNLYTDVTITLQKYDPTDPAAVGGWVDKDDLDAETYGVYYGFNEFTDFGSTDGRLKYVGATVLWQLVLFNEGEGTYRFRFNETLADASTDTSFYLFEFCLKEYKPFRADRTVRFSWYQKGFIGDFIDDNDIWDYINPAKRVGGDGWFNQMRLPDSFFGDNKSEYERQYIRYVNGQQVYLQDQQVEGYSYHSGMFPSELHDFIKTNILQADRILVTDYNKNNPNIIVDKAVKPSGNYEPSWNYNNLRAFVSVDFVQEFQNRRKLRC